MSEYDKRAEKKAIEKREDSEKVKEIVNESRREVNSRGDKEVRECIKSGGEHESNGLKWRDRVKENAVGP